MGYRFAICAGFTFVAHVARVGSWLFSQLSSFVPVKPGGCCWPCHVGGGRLVSARLRMGDGPVVHCRCGSGMTNATVAARVVRACGKDEKGTELAGGPLVKFTPGACLREYLL